MPIPPPRDLSDSGIELTSPALAGGFSTTEPPGKPMYQVGHPQTESSVVPFIGQGCRLPSIQMPTVPLPSLMTAKSTSGNAQTSPLRSPVLIQPLHGSDGDIEGWRWKSESEVAQSCLTLCNAVGCSLLGSSVHGILQARILEWVAISFSRHLPDAGIEPTSPALTAGFFTIEPPVKGEKSCLKSKASQDSIPDLDLFSARCVTIPLFCVIHWYLEILSLMVRKKKIPTSI